MFTQRWPYTLHKCLLNPLIEGLANFSSGGLLTLLRGIPDSSGGLLTLLSGIPDSSGGLLTLLRGFPNFSPGGFPPLHQIILFQLDFSCCQRNLEVSYSPFLKQILESQAEQIPAT
ncbi:hypothetical protein GDO81_012443 [Engystomops pustulosus]|uniref:Uncharacterized protein n=1 Tax=Engystomops pustulosus TaxID=76066 RepID=A0AAV7BLM4_ENGPU|nr:hypothetical protein GDO81_012443 [Engystomops pustulosus]